MHKSAAGDITPVASRKRVQRYDLFTKRQNLSRGFFNFSAKKLEDVDFCDNLNVVLENFGKRKGWVSLEEEVDYERMCERAFEGYPLPSHGLMEGVFLKLNLDFIKFKLDLNKFKFNFIKFKLDCIKSKFSFKKGAEKGRKGERGCDSIAA